MCLRRRRERAALQAEAVVGEGRKKEKARRCRRASPGRDPPGAADQAAFAQGSQVPKLGSGSQRFGELAARVARACAWMPARAEGDPPPHRPAAVEAQQLHLLKHLCFGAVRQRTQAGEPSQKPPCRARAASTARTHATRTSVPTPPTTIHAAAAWVGRNRRPDLTFLCANQN